MIGNIQKFKPKVVFDQIEAVLFDCDGVLWHGNNLVDGTIGLIKKLRELKKRYFFVTNSSNKSRQDILDKFKKLGVDGITGEDVITSSLATAFYLKESGYGPHSDKTAFVIAESGVCDELDNAGIKWIGGQSFNAKETPCVETGMFHDANPNVSAVVVGVDRQINYYKLNYAQHYINKCGAEFVATNPDATGHAFCAHEEWAAAALFVGALRGSCPKAHVTLVGKPAGIMIDYAAKQLGIQDRQKMLMVGDRLDTDIAFGKNHGMRTC